MKKLLTVILTMTFLLNCSIFVVSAEDVGMQEDDNIQSGSSEWDRLSIQERYAVSSIDAGDVAAMTTDAVLLAS